MRFESESIFGNMSFHADDSRYETLELTRERSSNAEIEALRREVDTLKDEVASLRRKNRITAGRLKNAVVRIKELMQ